MDKESDFLPNKCGRRADGRVDRISQLPDEILFVILSFLRLKEAASTTVLSSRWLDLWKDMPNLKFDRISQLPNQSIVVILSFLPLREAATTSVLSSRWSDLWKHTPYLNFEMHYDPYYDDRFPNESNASYKCMKLVNSAIQSHKALSLKKIRLAVPVYGVDKCIVTKWLEFVFSRQIESLELMLTDAEDVFVLEELLKESRTRLQPQTDLIFFQSLKILCLGDLKVSGEDIKLFLRDCPLLEELKMTCVTLTSDVEVCGEKLMLKHLVIADCMGENSIKVSAPNLTYMKFSLFGERGEGKLLFEKVPKLVEADFRISRSDFASSASGCFSQLQILKLDPVNSEVLFQLQVILSNVFTQMPNLKKLVIRCRCPYEYNHNLLSVAALILAYPHLEEFKLGVYEFRGRQPAYTQVMTDVGRSPHQHLKVFELEMSRHNEIGDVVELVKYVSNNCVALRKIIVDHQRTYGDLANGDDWADFTQRLQGKVPNHIQLELFDSTSYFLERLLFCYRSDNM